MWRLFVLVFCAVGCVNVERVTYRLGYSFSEVGGLGEVVRIEAEPFRVNVGERVNANVVGAQGKMRARLMRPLCVPERLMPLEERALAFRVDPEDPKGLYVLTTVVRTKSGRKLIAKRSFLSGSLTADFFCPDRMPKGNPAIYVPQYLQSFRALGGNLVIFHPSVGRDRPFYESGLTTKRVVPANDMLDMVLRECSRRGIAVLVSVCWDRTAEIAHEERMASLYKLAAEIYFRYGGYPAFCGFYLYQKGSNRAFVELVRQVASFLKRRINPGLLFACSAYVDDPLVAGYLAQVEGLDIVVADSAVMSSFGGDEEVRFPVRRVADFTRMFATAARVCGKMVLGGVELSAPLALSKNRLCPPSILRDQLLALAASIPLDGLVLSSYYADVFVRRGEEAASADEEVLQEALPAFWMVQSLLPQPPVALYIPYTTRRSGYLLRNALRCADELRRLGLYHTIAVFVPPEREMLPFWIPAHPNREQAGYLRRHHPVLLLANIVRLEGADGEMVANFIAGGGVACFVGPHFAESEYFERATLIGAEETVKVAADHILIRADMGYLREGQKIALKGKVEFDTLLHKRGVVLARVDEEHIAAQAVRFGEGFVIATPLALWEKNAALSAVLTNILLEAVFTAGREHVVFEHPLPEETDVVCGSKDGRLVVCVVNRTDKELPVSMLLPKSLREGAVVSILSSEGGVRKVVLDKRQAEVGVRFRVPPHWFALMLLEGRKRE